MKTCTDEPFDSWESNRSFRTGENCKPGPLLAAPKLLEARELRVREIRQRIEAGTYSIDPRNIAKKMMDKICCSYS